jgi:hypothetical protein
MSVANSRLHFIPCPINEPHPPDVRVDMPPAVAQRLVALVRVLARQAAFSELARCRSRGPIPAGQSDQ